MRRGEKQRGPSIQRKTKKKTLRDARIDFFFQKFSQEDLQRRNVQGKGGEKGDQEAQRLQKGGASRNDERGGGKHTGFIRIDETLNNNKGGKKINKIEKERGLWKKNLGLKESKIRESICEEAENTSISAEKRRGLGARVRVGGRQTGKKKRGGGQDHGTLENQKIRKRDKEHCR